MTWTLRPVIDSCDPNEVSHHIDADGRLLFAFPTNVNALVPTTLIAAMSDEAFQPRTHEAHLWEFLPQGDANAYAIIHKRSHKVIATFLTNGELLVMKQAEILAILETRLQA